MSNFMGMGIFWIGLMQPGWSWLLAIDLKEAEK